MTVKSSTSRLSKWIFNFIVDPRYKILRHILFLMTIGMISFQLSYREFSEDATIYASAAFFITFIVVIYLNMYFLAPRFLFKGRLGVYLLLAIASTFLALSALSVLQRLSISGSEMESMKKILPLFGLLNSVSSIFAFGLVLGSSSAMLIYQRWILQKQRIEELETITLQTELTQLKNQISPHFLFNTLNNANVLIKEAPEEAARVLFKLDDLLKYQMKDSARHHVLLEDDISFLTDYLNLEKIRRDNFEFIIHKEGDTQNIIIPPLLFIPFVENAVKHSFDGLQHSYVHVEFKVEEGELHFSCVNSKPVMHKVEQSAGGLGLSNIRRRLELLYGEDFSLDIIDETLSFKVSLLLFFNSKILEAR